MKAGLVSLDFFLFTFGFTFRKHTGNISISEISISYLFRKTNVSIKSSLILPTTNAVLGLVRYDIIQLLLDFFAHVTPLLL